MRANEVGLRVDPAERGGRWKSGPVDRLIEEIAAVWTRDTDALARNVSGSERRAVDSMEDDVGKGKPCHGYFMTRAPGRNSAGPLLFPVQDDPGITLFL